MTPQLYRLRAALNLALNKKMLRLVPLLAVGVLAVSLSGCGVEHRTT